ncbi:MAG: hypothetical protein ABIV39_03100 [Verrucomicrobiota bacterium]
MKKKFTPTPCKRCLRHEKTILPDAGVEEVKNTVARRKNFFVCRRLGLQLIPAIRGGESVGLTSRITVTENIFENGLRFNSLEKLFQISLKTSCTVKTHCYIPRPVPPVVANGSDFSVTDN